MFSIIAGLQCSVNFLLYSKVTQSHIHIDILFFHIIMLHCKWLDIVPRAIQMDIVAYPFQRQEFASINPKFPAHPTLSSSPLATTSLKFWKVFIRLKVERPDKIFDSLKNPERKVTLMEAAGTSQINKYFSQHWEAD